MINKLLSILKAYADYANVLDCYTHILSRYSQSIIESQRASLRNEIERLQNRFGNFANEFEKCKNSFSFSTNILTLLNHFLEEKKRSAFVKKVFVLFDELLRKLNSGSNRDQQYEKVKEEYKRLLIRHRELPEALYKELNEKWELVRAEAKEKNLLLPPLSNLANELVPISERKPLQNENLSHDTNPKRTASVLKDKQCMYLKKLEESYRKLMYEHDSGNFEKLNEEKSQCLRYIDAIQPYLEQEYNEFLTQDDKLELRKNTRSVEIAKILWIFHVLKETLNKLHYDQSLKDKQLIVTTIENQAQLAIEKYVSLLIEYKGLPYNLYQELSSKWKNVLSKHSALHPDVLPWPLPDLPELSQLVGIPSFFITYSRGMVDELINSPITKRLKFSTQQTGSLKVVDDNPHILILAPMIFSQGYTPTIEDVKSLCEQRQVNLDDLCVTNCVEDSEMKQVGSAKPATEEDWRKAGIDNVSQLKIANRTFLIPCGYNIGDKGLFKPFTVSDLWKITERINRSPSLVYCFAGKSRSVMITAAAMFKRCWDEGRSHVSADPKMPTIPFCSISSVITYLCVLRPEIKSANKTIEQFSDAGQSLTLLLFCWRVVSTKLNDDRINDWLTKSNFIHDVEITLKKFIAPSHVEEQLLALPESVDDIKNFVEVLNKFAEDKLDKLLREALQGQNCCHLIIKFLDVTESSKAEVTKKATLRIVGKCFMIAVLNQGSSEILRDMYQAVQGDEYTLATQLVHIYFASPFEERFHGWIDLSVKQRDSEWCEATARIMLEQLKALSIELNQLQEESSSTIAQPNSINDKWRFIAELHGYLYPRRAILSENVIKSLEIALQEATNTCMVLYDSGKLKSLLPKLATNFRPLQKILRIRFPQSYFSELNENYALLRDTNFDLATIITQDPFCREIGRNQYEYYNFFFSDENTRTEVCRQIEAELDQLGLDGIAKEPTRGRKKLDLFKQHLFSELGITSEYLRNYIAVAIVQQSKAVKVEIAGKNRLINFLFAISDEIIKKLIEIIYYYIELPVVLRGLPQTTINYDRNERSAVLSFSVEIMIVDRDTNERIPASRAQYYIKLYEDRSKLPEFNFDIYFDKEVLHFSNGDECNLIQMISIYFNQPSISQLCLEDRRLIILNKILNDLNGKVTLNLLSDTNLMETLGLTEVGYANELKQIIEEKFGQSSGIIANRFKAALGYFEEFTQLFVNERVRRDSMAQLAIYELSLAKEQLQIVVKDQKYPKLLRINGDIALEYVRKVIHETANVDQRKLAKFLHNIRYLILYFTQPNFQSQLSEKILYSILQSCGEPLVSLYLNGCQYLSLNKVLNLARFCPKLQILYFQDLPKFIKVSKARRIYYFPELTELHLINCQSLKSFQIHAPNLRKLRVINCPNLYKLKIYGRITQDKGINNYVIEDCPKLITRFNLPALCFNGLLADYAAFQVSEVDATVSLSRMSSEVSRSNYDLMFFGKHCRAGMQEHGEARLASFDQRLQAIGISNKYLRDYVALVLIQGSGEDILGSGRDLSFAYGASRLICQKLEEIVNQYVETTNTKFTTGVSNLIPKIKYNAVNDSVNIEFADSISIYEDNDKQTQLGFARYGIILYADRSELPDFTCSLDLYNSVAMTIANQKFKLAEILSADFDSFKAAWSNKNDLEKYLDLIPEREEIDVITPEVRTELTMLLFAIQGL